MAAVLGLAAPGMLEGQAAPAPDTGLRVPVVVTLKLRGRHYEALRGAELRILVERDGRGTQRESRLVADISPGTPACGGARGERTCSIAATATPGPKRFVVELVPAPPVGDSFPEVYPRPVADETLTVTAGGTDTVAFAWEAPTLLATWGALLGLRSHLAFALPLALLSGIGGGVLLARPLRRGGWRLLLVSGVMAIAIPWLAGAAVKLWLQAHGQPTYPWGWFLERLPQVVMLGALFGAPLFWVGWMAERLLPRVGDTHRRRRWTVAALGAMAATTAGMTLSAVALFWVFEPLAFFAAPYLWLAWAPLALAGAMAGWALGGRRQVDGETGRRMT